MIILKCCAYVPAFSVFQKRLASLLCSWVNKYKCLGFLVCFCLIVQSQTHGKSYLNTVPRYNFNQCLELIFLFLFFYIFWSYSSQNATRSFINLRLYILDVIF